MKGPIFNARSVKLFNDPGTLPDVSGALLNYFQNMVFTRIVKTVINFVVTENPTDIVFRGVMQPYTPQRLDIKMQGERNWIWNTLHAEPGLPLYPDDVVIYQKTQYRIMSKSDYSSYGYVEYKLVQDYTGSGPNT